MATYLSPAQEGKSHLIPIDDDWDSPNSGVSKQRRKQAIDQKSHRNASPGTATREAQRWLTASKNHTVSDSHRTRRPILTNSSGIKPQTPTKSSARQIKVSETLGLDPTSPPNQIPPNFLETIVEAFSPDADLYNDVLQVSRHASAREIRIAYFRRGRQVLAENDAAMRSQGSASVGATVSKVAKLRFQAVSMAYEILSDPTWCKAYHYYGLTKHTVTSQIRVSSVPVSSVLRLGTRSSSLGRKSRNGNAGVRWNEEVEELVFDKDPSELENEDTKSKKKKKKVVVDTAGLESHLEQLDREAKKYFSTDFLDEVESSIEDLLSIGSGSKDEKKKNSFDIGSFDDDDDEVFEHPRSGSPQKTRSQRAKGEALPKEVRQSGSCDGVPKSSTRELQVTNPSCRKPGVSKGIRCPMPVSSQLTTKRRGRNSVARRRFDGPSDIIISRWSKPDDGTVQTSDTISTISASVVDKLPPASTPQRAHPSLAKVREESESPVKAKTELPSVSGALSPAGRYRRLGAGVARLYAQDDGYDLGCDADICCGDDEATREVKSVPEVGGVFGSRHQPKTEDSKQEFYFHLLSYFRSLVADFYDWGESVSSIDWDISGLMEAFSLSEDDVNGMLGILKTEIDSSGTGLEVDEIENVR